MTAMADPDPPNEPASPACSMHEADDAYMGYAGRDELIAFLNLLFEAERAGARVTLESARETGGEIAELLATIQRDEARWCGLLHEAIVALGGTPSAEIGGFYAKAMAIPAMDARLAFLNRGQAWVVRQLREMLPKIRSDALHAGLAEMLRAHEANIALAETVARRHFG